MPLTAGGEEAPEPPFGRDSQSGRMRPCLAPYRRNMTAAQIEQLHKQYVRKRLLEQRGVPRLSLFYMH